MALLEDVAKSPDRALAARGLLYLAQLQERTDKVAASKTYQRIEKDFSSQREIAAEARARATALTVATATPELADRLVLPSNRDRFQGSTITADGRSLEFGDYETGSPAIRNMATGAEVRLANGTPHDNYKPRHSPDGKRISYVSLGEIGRPNKTGRQSHRKSTRQSAPHDLAGSRGLSLRRADSAWVVLRWHLHSGRGVAG